MHRCGMCMTGCPYGLIYSAAQTFDALRRASRVTLHGGFLALKIIEEANRVAVITKEIATGRMRRFEADRVYVACGAIGTTRLVANSLGLFDVDLPMLESRQFILPLLSLRATEDPRNKRDFTLNQFNMIVAPDGGATRYLDTSLLYVQPCVHRWPSVSPPRPLGRVASGAATAPSDCRIRLFAIVEFLSTAHTYRISITITRSSPISYFQRSPSPGAKPDAPCGLAPARSVGPDA